LEGLAIAVGIVGGIAILLRALRVALVATEQSVRIRNVFRTVDLAWGDVAGFSDGVYVLGEGSDEHWTLRVEMRNGQNVQAFAMFAGVEGRASTIEALRSLAHQHHVPESLTGTPAPAPRGGLRRLLDLRHDRRPTP